MDVSNPGSNDAFSIQIANSNNTNDVTLSTALPETVGDVAANNNSIFTLKYSAPEGISVFRSSVFATAKDAGGFSHSYP